MPQIYLYLNLHTKINNDRIKVTAFASIIEEKTKIKPTPQEPISPLGEKLFKVNKQDIN